MKICVRGSMLKAYIRTRPQQFHLTAICSHYK